MTHKWGVKEIYHIGFRVGYDQAVQDIRLAKGGDGEYRNTIDVLTWRESMKENKDG